MQNQTYLHRDAENSFDTTHVLRKCYHDRQTKDKTPGEHSKNVKIGPKSLINHNSSVELCLQTKNVLAMVAIPTPLNRHVCYSSSFPASSLYPPHFFSVLVQDGGEQHDGKK